MGVEGNRDRMQALVYKCVALKEQWHFVYTRTCSSYWCSYFVATVSLSDYAIHVRFEGVEFLLLQLQLCIAVIQLAWKAHTNMHTHTCTHTHTHAHTHTHTHTPHTHTPHTHAHTHTHTRTHTHQMTHWCMMSSHISYHWGQWWSPEGPCSSVTQELIHLNNKTTVSLGTHWAQVQVHVYTSTCI